MTAFDIINNLLILEHNGRTLQNFFTDQGVKRIAIYGLGTVGARVLEVLDTMDIDVIAGIDKNANKMRMKDIFIYAPEQIDMIKPIPELIVVTPMEHYYDIKEELKLYTKIDVISIGEIVEYCVVGEPLKESFPTIKTVQNQKKLYCNITTSLPTNCLKNSIVVITGASSGIGRATAEKVVAEGGNVIAIGRNRVNLSDLEKKINCSTLCIDINECNTSSLFYELEKQQGKKITSFVNNAGIYISRTMGEYSRKDFEEVLYTNLISASLLMQAFVCYCIKRKIAGNMVVTASDRSLYGDVGPYGASKAGLVNVMEGYAREVMEYGIRVNAVSPGMTASGINGIDKESNIYDEFVRGNRVLLAEEIAEVICWLLSDYSSCITGANIPCDMGHFLR